MTKSDTLRRGPQHNRRRCALCGRAPRLPGHRSCKSCGYNCVHIAKHKGKPRPEPPAAARLTCGVFTFELPMQMSPRDCVVCKRETQSVPVCRECVWHGAVLLPPYSRFLMRPGPSPVWQVRRDWAVLYRSRDADGVVKGSFVRCLGVARVAADGGIRATHLRWGRGDREDKLWERASTVSVLYSGQTLILGPGSEIVQVDIAFGRVAFMNPPRSYRTPRSRGSSSSETHPTQTENIGGT